MTNSTKAGAHTPKVGLQDSHTAFLLQRKPTAGRWSYEQEKVSGPVHEKTHLFANGCVIGTIYGDSEAVEAGYDNVQANAALIVRAVNSHAALVEALKEIDRICAPGESDPQRMAMMLTKIAVRANAAIAAAEGGV